jgi:hypothetical protein
LKLFSIFKALRQSNSFKQSAAQKDDSLCVSHNKRDTEYKTSIDRKRIIPASVKKGGVNGSDFQL